MNAAQLISLPTETPFGNLLLKLLKIFTRLGHANVRISEAHLTWHELVSATWEPSGDIGQRGQFFVEEAVYMLRRAADECVGTVWLLAERERTGNYPLAIDIDSIGGAISDGRKDFSRHEQLLTTLNEISNTHKHSFIDSSQSIIGQDEPCVVAFALKRNDLSREARTWVVGLDDLVSAFNTFLTDMLDVMQRHVATIGRAP